jgi:hypothetical protein
MKTEPLCLLLTFFHIISHKREKRGKGNAAELIHKQRASGATQTSLKGAFWLLDIAINELVFWKRRKLARASAVRNVNFLLLASACRKAAISHAQAFFFPFSRSVFQYITAQCVQRNTQFKEKGRTLSLHFKEYKFYIKMLAGNFLRIMVLMEDEL